MFGLKATEPIQKKNKDFWALNFFLVESKLRKLFNCKYKLLFNWKRKDA